MPYVNPVVYSGIQYPEFHMDDVRWKEKQLREFPYTLACSVAKEHKRKRLDSSYRDANLWLLGLLEKTEGQRFNLAGSEDELRTWADGAAKESGLSAARFDDSDNAYLFLSEMWSRRGWDIPEPTDDIQASGLVGRMKDPLWWRRQARKRWGQGCEGVAVSGGLVRKGREHYVSNDALQRRTGQRTRNAAMLAECQLVNELGQEFTLEELSAVSTSNPEIRRAELMTRIKGYELVAESRGDVWDFYTWTLPSRYHASSKHYDGLLPGEGHAQLNLLWQRARAALARRGCNTYGLRVAEPHKDGCPHWHLLLFFPESSREAVREVLQGFALAESPNEPGAQENRFTAIAGDPHRGGAAGYVAKYVSKNIDAYGLEKGQGDLYGDADPLESARRVDAWASTWRIRQFQFIGGPPVGPWRELRRLGHELDGVLEQCRAAADGGDWAGYVQAQGGPFCGRDARVKTAAWHEFNAETGECESPMNKYGESKAAAVFGVSDGNESVLTRVHQWEPVSGHKQAKADGVKLGGNSGVGVGWSGGSVYPAGGWNLDRERQGGAIPGIADGGGFGGMRGISAIRVSFPGKEASGIGRRERVAGVDLAVIRSWTRVNNCTGAGVEPLTPAQIGAYLGREKFKGTVNEQWNEGGGRGIGAFYRIGEVP